MKKTIRVKYNAEEACFEYESRNYNNAVGICAKEAKRLGMKPDKDYRITLSSTRIPGKSRAIYLKKSYDSNSSRVLVKWTTRMTEMWKDFYFWTSAYLLELLGPVEEENKYYLHIEEVK